MNSITKYRQEHPSSPLLWQSPSKKIAIFRGEGPKDMVAVVDYVRAVNAADVRRIAKIMRRLQRRKQASG